MRGGKNVFFWIRELSRHGLISHHAGEDGRPANMTEILAVIQAEMNSIRADSQRNGVSKFQKDENGRRLTFLQQKFDSIIENMDKIDQNMQNNVFTRAEARSWDGLLENVALFLSNFGLAWVAKHHAHKLSSHLALILDPSTLAWPLGTGLIAYILAKLGQWWLRTPSPTSRVPGKIVTDQLLEDPQSEIETLETELDFLNLNPTPKRRSNRLHAPSSEL